MHQYVYVCVFFKKPYKNKNQMCTPFYFCKSAQAAKEVKQCWNDNLSIHFPMLSNRVYCSLMQVRSWKATTPRVTGPSRGWGLLPD